MTIDSLKAALLTKSNIASTMEDEHALLHQVQYIGRLPRQPNCSRILAQLGQQRHPHGRLEMHDKHMLPLTQVAIPCRSDTVAFNGYKAPVHGVEVLTAIETYLRACTRS